MKIAAITDDGVSISEHFGRAPFYAVLTIENDQIVSREMRDKLGHQQFVHQEGQLDEQGRHGFGAGAQQRHAAMARAISDCDALLCRGMGWGAYESIRQSGIRCVVTDIPNIEAAVQAFLDGTIVDHTDRLH